MDAPDNHSPHSTSRPTVGFEPPSGPSAQTGAMSLPEEQPSAVQPPDDIPRPYSKLDHALLGNVTRRPTSTPSASVHIVPDPDTLSSDSTVSLRAQLRLNTDGLVWHVRRHNMSGLLDDSVWDCSRVVRLATSRLDLFFRLAYERV
ncbi:hypothetical protein BHE74_00043554 [Ensete ventricosum]|nr:hypothetical protein BHE74_00043554 [Ensete ventricosum]